MVTINGKLDCNYTLLHRFKDILIVRYSQFNFPSQIYAIKFRQSDLKSLCEMLYSDNLQIILLEQSKNKNYTSFAQPEISKRDFKSSPPKEIVDGKIYYLAAPVEEVKEEKEKKDKKDKKDKKHKKDEILQLVDFDPNLTPRVFLDIDEEVK